MGTWGNFHLGRVLELGVKNPFPFPWVYIRSFSDVHCLTFSGISFKTQALYAAVFCTRYVDLSTGHIVSVYNTVMKVFFIGSSFYILYLMKQRLRATWDPKVDTLRVEFLVVPCALLALVANYKFTVIEVSTLGKFVF